MTRVASETVSNKRLAMFLNFLAETGRVDHSAALASICTTTVYKKRKEDPEFAAKWQEALDQAGDVLESEAIRRAKDGVMKPVFYKGEVCGEVREYSDGLMNKLLEGAKPEKYNKKINEHKGSVNVNVGLAVIPMTAPRVEDWEKDSLAMHQTIIDVTPTRALSNPDAPTSSTPMKIVRV